MARWRRRFRAENGGVLLGVPVASTTTPPASAAELARENRALRRELQEVRQQREVLKKAVAIFSEAPR